jgi:hypothetical protein
MRMVLKKQFTLFKSLEAKFNELMDKGEYDASYGIALALVDELRKTATDIEQGVCQNLRVGVVNRAMDRVDGRK